MSAFDVRAVAWVVARDAFVDMVRASFGASRRVRPGVLAALAQQWNDLERAQRAERCGASGREGIVLAAPPAAASAEALDAFVRRLAAECPEWYGPAALWRRWRMRLLQATIGSSSGLILAAGSSPDTPLADVALVMLVMSMWCLLTTVQLWRTYRLVIRLSEQQTRQEGNALALEAKKNSTPRS